MNEEQESLLMMFISDTYNGAGKIRKKTIIKMMNYVNNDQKLQILVNNSDHKGVANYRKKIESFSRATHRNLKDNYEIYI